jgi:alkyldihydroxyacetonephosphate synthase
MKGSHKVIRKGNWFVSTLSFWGWGYNENFPDEATIDYLAERLRDRFDLTGLRREPEPTLNDLSLPDPGLSPPDELVNITSHTTNDRALYTYGKGYPDLVRGFQGDFESAPDCVTFPESPEDVQRILEWGREDSLVVVPVGGGTNVVKGIEPEVQEETNGIVAVSTRRMNEVLEVDQTSRTARIQAGATGPELEDQLQAHGLTLRHYPQSYEFSTLGGWIATRSAGHFATVETRIDDLTVSIQCITPEGIIETPDYPSSGAGPDPDRLLLGSEGTLGFITEATMRVRPVPTCRAGATVAFDDFMTGVDACRELVQSGLNPANCRYISEEEVELYSLADDPANLLFLGFESGKVSVEPDLKRAMELTDDHGGDTRDRYVTDTGSTDSESGTSRDWKQAFFEAPYLFNGMVQLGVIVDTFETCCRWNQFESLHHNLMTETEKILEEVCGDGLVTARLTHLYPEGPAPYYTIVAPGDGKDLIAKWTSIKNSVSSLFQRHGGTITHHHAVGRVHKPWYRNEMPELYRQSLRSVKNTMDPDHILNPGILL